MNITPQQSKNCLISDFFFISIMHILADYLMFVISIVDLPCIQPATWTAEEDTSQRQRWGPSAPRPV